MRRVRVNNGWDFMRSLSVDGGCDDGIVAEAMELDSCACAVIAMMYVVLFKFPCVDDLLVSFYAMGDAIRKLIVGATKPPM